MEKKSLIKNLKATKKANLVTAPAKNEGATSRKSVKRAAFTGKKAGIMKMGRIR